jgi:hypothetical protein
MDKKLVVLVATITNDEEMNSPSEAIWEGIIDLTTPNVNESVLVDPTTERYQAWIGMLVDECISLYRDTEHDESEDEPTWETSPIPELEKVIGPSVDLDLEFVNKSFKVGGIYTVSIMKTEAF